MKIAILSRNLGAYSTRRLKQAAIDRGHRTFVLNTLRFSLGVEQEKPALYYKGKELSHYDAVIPRIGASITLYGLAVLRQFEQMGVFNLNPATSIARSRDKLHAMQILSRHDVGMPVSAFVHRREDVLPAIQRVGGAPVILKLLEGTQGVGVILAETEKVAQAIIETLQSTKQHVLIQKFVKESRGSDIRALVVGDRVVAAMRRTASGDEFRSNIHRGGKAQSVELPPDFVATAVRAAQIMGLRVAGVDMLEGTDGPQIMEVNSSPGLEGIETSTGVDVAGQIIEDLENRVLFPEVDLRQRLSLSAGHAIAEFVVHGMPHVAGRKLRDTDFRERNIQVLSITRGAKNIPNPRGEIEVLEGDRLLCFGEMRELRSMMPEPAKRPRRVKPRTQA